MAAPTESKNFSALTALAAAPADTDELYIQDVSEGVATNKPKRITFANLTANLATAAQGALADTALQPADLDSDLLTFSVPANTTISAFGATLVDDANAAAAIATLGLDADLATFAVPANTAISAFGATLVDDAAAVNARATLGLVIGTDIVAVAGSQQTLYQSGASASCDGTTNENILATYTLPAGTMGANDIIEIDSLWTYTNSANNKLVFHRFGGTDFLAPILTTSARSQLKCIIRAANSVSAQIGHVPTVVTPYGSSGVSAVSGTVNTANNVTISIIGQKATAGEVLTLLGCSIILRRAP